ncbi:peptidyl-prolyl cis-trans isomerase [Peribacillus saganii]|uniref:Peptidyl-prolyl cis-trans isomerase n=1 Tax=Peribacillus saganii TaxID=2303992 RepID=A0A372LSH5_9BACI|nr:peptidyl-prolyl cis-trans isomerase [Peribacillus saganii]RFU71133.1 peptidyl-prolyl cis-trans isomerase [Peribacillus saganii]
MESIILLTGNVKFPITLDPGVWIFDDRKVDLNTYFEKEEKKDNEMEEYTKAVSEHWDREIREGAVFPPTLKTEKKYEKERILTGTFGIPFKPFLTNAEPEDSSTKVIVETTTEEHTFTFEQAKAFILGFSIDGKPLIEDGPVYVYFGDGSNVENPIKRVKRFTVK